MAGRAIIRRPGVSRARAPTGCPASTTLGRRARFQEIGRGRAVRRKKREDGEVDRWLKGWMDIEVVL